MVRDPEVVEASVNSSILIGRAEVVLEELRDHISTLRHYADDQSADDNARSQRKERP
jgi:hypothetical protein